MRLDKWLWAARFFKTRQLACEAINGGKVQLNGQRTRPGKGVRPGSRLRIHKGSLEWEIVVTAVNKQRRPAGEAALLYQESEDSHRRRQQQVAERRTAGAVDERVHGRPSKRDRRMIHRFTEGDDR